MARLHYLSPVCEARLSKIVGAGQVLGPLNSGTQSTHKEKARAEDLPCPYSDAAPFIESKTLWRAFHIYDSAPKAAKDTLRLRKRRLF
jgi:hypothetical protein